MADIELTSGRDRARLRKTALDRQGLLRDAPFGRGKRAALRAIEHIGYVQIDTISVVERAHNHVWWSRVPNFSATMLEELLAERGIFEYWAHAASFLPMRDFRYSLPMKERYRTGAGKWIRSRDTKLMDEILRRIEAEGAVRSRDLEDPRTSRAGWWDWKPAKRAVEQLYMQGDLMISDRDGFQKSYDLTERVLPSGVDTRMPSIEACAAHRIDEELRCHELATLKAFTYGRRGYPELRAAVKREVQRRTAAGELDAIKLPDNQTYYAAPGLLDRSAPRTSTGMRILSPFDNAVIQRERLVNLFDFDYQIECYVPEAKRRYGYFALPLLYRDEFVGRMDCKAHRRSRALEIRQLHLEPGVAPDATLVDAFARCMAGFLTFQECDVVELGHVEPRAAKASLAHALKIKL